MRLFLLLIIFSVSCFAESGSMDSLNVAGNGMLVQKYRLRVIAENSKCINAHDGSRRAIP